ncbi:MAG: hypothetical protein MI866_03045 [Bacteroidales bacterium]|nr:hypothetical protein [Bacteroidales bacterium]
MKSISHFEIMNVQQLSVEEMRMVNGGLTTEQLVKAAWDATPSGGNSTWTSNGDGSWSGIICYNGGCPGAGVIFPDGTYRAAWPGLY